MWFVRLNHYLVGIFTLLAIGCGHPTPQERLVGKWQGTPQVIDAVDDAVKTAAQGQKVNPLAQGAARFLGNALAKATMSVEVEFRDTGTVFFRGNTAALGLPPDSDGKWKVISADGDTAAIEIVVDEMRIESMVVFRDRDEFTWKLKLPEPSPSPRLAAGAEPASHPAEKTADKSSPGGAAPSTSEAPAKKSAISIIFKRE